MVLHLWLELLHFRISLVKDILIYQKFCDMLESAEFGSMWMTRDGRRAVYIGKGPDDFGRIYYFVVEGSIHRTCVHGDGVLIRGQETGLDIMPYADKKYPDYNKMYIKG